MTTIIEIPQTEIAPTATPDYTLILPLDGRGEDGGAYALAVRLTLPIIDAWCDQIERFSRRWQPGVNTERVLHLGLDQMPLHESYIGGEARLINVRAVGPMWTTLDGIAVYQSVMIEDSPFCLVAGTALMAEPGAAEIPDAEITRLVDDGVWWTSSFDVAGGERTRRTIVALDLDTLSYLRQTLYPAATPRHVFAAWEEGTATDMEALLPILHRIRAIRREQKALEPLYEALRAQAERIIKRTGSVNIPGFVEAGYTSPSKTKGVNRAGLEALEQRIRATNPALADEIAATYTETPRRGSLRLEWSE